MTLQGEGQKLPTPPRPLKVFKSGHRRRFDGLLSLSCPATSRLVTSRLCQTVLSFCHIALRCRASGSPPAWVMHEGRALPPLAAGDIFALERLKAAGMNQLSKGT